MKIKHGLALSLLFCWLQAAYAWQGIVVRVADGDTITIQKEDGSRHKLRLYGVDAPELKQKWGSESRKAAQKLAINKLVEVDEQYRDPYKRIVAIVTLPDGRVLQEVMVESGMAWVYEGYCKKPVCDGWRKKMGYARTSRRGLWREAYPYPPWEWRKAQRLEAQEKQRQ